MQELVPIRYGRMLVSPFTFYRGAAAVMAADLAATPDSGIVGPGLRRRAHLELRRVRGSGPQARLRAERLRRDAARPVGVGRQADGGERRDRRPRRRSAGRPPAADRDGCVREYREGMRGVRAREPSRRLVRPPQRERAGRSLRRAAGAKGRILFAKPFAKARRKTSLRAVEKLTERVHGELRFRSVPPLLVPLRDLLEPADAARRGRLRPRAAGRVRRRPRPGPALPLRHLPVRRHGPQGRRRRQRRHPRLDIPARRPRRQGSARAAGEGGAGIGAGAVPGRQRVREPWRTRRPGPADLARGHRHLPQLAAKRGP